MEKEKKLKIAVIIFAIITVLEFLVIIVIFIYFKPKGITNKSIYASNYSNSKLVDMFEEEGYNINFMNIDDCLYILLENEKNGIVIQRIPKTLVGPLMTFRNKSINDEMADILTPSSNDTIEKQSQYKNYEEWLKNYNISTYQVTEMLEDYYDKNKFKNDKMEVINTQELLNSTRY